MGAYGLQTLITRYVQTPASADYGVGGTTLMAGLILVPFAVSGVAGGWLAHRGARLTAPGSHPVAQVGSCGPSRLQVSSASCLRYAGGAPLKRYVV